MIRGGGYKGSSAQETSVAGQEIIPVAPADWNVGYSFYKFAFYNDTNCTVKINGEEPIFLLKGQGFTIDRFDEPIHSFIIVEAGVIFNWLGAH